MTFREHFAMPYLSFFADEEDAKLLLNRLNIDPEIAFIIATGPKSTEEVIRERLEPTLSPGAFTAYELPPAQYRQRWKAVKVVDAFAEGANTLWHVPTGRLQQMNDAGNVEDIADPWLGWQEGRPAAIPNVPYLAMSPSEIRLSLWSRTRPYTAEERETRSMLVSYWDAEKHLLVASDFQWVRGRPRQSRRGHVGGTGSRRGSGADVFNWCRDRRVSGRCRRRSRSFGTESGTALADFHWMTPFAARSRDPDQRGRFPAAASSSCAQAASSGVSGG